MALRTIVAIPEKVLRRKARPVTKFGDDLQVLIEDMIDTMRDAPGVGLAAPQVAASIQLIVVEYGDDEDESVPKKLYIMANPVISRMSKEIEVGVEGCLSIPGIVGEVERSISITIKGMNRHGQPMTVRAAGWLARIFQHEIDHLNGVLFTDRADKVWKPTEPFEDRV